MLAKQSRFHGSRDIKRTLRQGRIGYGRDFAVRSLGSGQSRTAVIVSKKVHKSAVMRNRIRRRVAAAIQQIRTTDGYRDDVVLIAKSADLAGSDYANLKQEIGKALGRYQ